MTPTLPQTLGVVRHGQSAGNVACNAVEAGGLHVIDIATRDADVPLSDLGRRQSQSLGHWSGRLPLQKRPQVLLCSPYVRAQETPRLLLDHDMVLQAVGRTPNSKKIAADKAGGKILGSSSVGTYAGNVNGADCAGHQDCGQSSALHWGRCVTSSLRFLRKNWLAAREVGLAHPVS
jgi:hypothetical protein